MGEGRSLEDVSNAKDFTHVQQRTLFLQTVLACRIKCHVNAIVEADYSGEPDDVIEGWCLDKGSGDVPQIIQDEVKDERYIDVCRATRLKKCGITMALAKSLPVDHAMNVFD